jgi:hypothetical protein
VTTDKHIGAKEDAEFFDEVRAISERYPEAVRRYAFANLALEKRMGIDRDRLVGISRVEDGQVITRFVDRDETGRVLLAEEAAGRAASNLRTRRQRASLPGKSDVHWGNLMSTSV